MLDLLLGILQGIYNSNNINGYNQGYSNNINQYLKGDLSLKNIATSQQLLYLKNSGQLNKVSIPAFISNDEMNINYSPLTKIDFYKIYLKMIVEDRESISLNYYGINQGQFNDIFKIAQDSFEEFANLYPELTSYFSGIAVRSSYGRTQGTLSLSFSWDNNFGQVFSFNDIQETIYACAFIINELRKNNKITDYMSEYEKAKVIYQWVIFHSQYANENNSRLDYTPSSFLFYGKAVCQAYVGVFNLLCKMEKINITGISGKTIHSKNGSTHIWSFAILDGKQVYIDVTWGDPVLNNQNLLRMQGIDPENICDFTYFDIPKYELMKSHNWNDGYYENLIINKK